MEVEYILPPDRLRRLFRELAARATPTGFSVIDEGLIAQRLPMWISVLVVCRCQQWRDWKVLELDIKNHELEGCLDFDYVDHYQLGRRITMRGLKPKY